MVSVKTFLLLASIAVVIAFANAEGFNNKIAWVRDINEGKRLAAEQNKPAFVLIHKTWCGACKRLKNEFNSAAAEEIVTKSKDFVMIELEDDKEPNDAVYSPDGGYYPRIVFMTPQGEVRKDIFNQQRAGGEYKYFYSDARSVSNGLTHALNILRQ